MQREQLRDRERERRALQSLAAAWGVEYGQHPYGYAVDGYLHRSGVVGAWVEVKGVRHELDAYPSSTLRIQIEKVDELWRYCQLDGRRPRVARLLVFAFDDALLVYTVGDVLDSSTEVVEGRKDRGSDEAKPCFRVPLAKARWQLAYTEAPL